MRYIKKEKFRSRCQIRPSLDNKPKVTSPLKCLYIAPFLSGGRTLVFCFNNPQIVLCQFSVLGRFTFPPPWSTVHCHTTAAFKQIFGNPYQYRELCTWPQLLQFRRTSSTANVCRFVRDHDFRGVTSFDKMTWHSPILDRRINLKPTAF